MSTPLLTVVIVLAVAIVVVAIISILRTRRSEKLRARFGPEHSRAVDATGSKAKAQSTLEKLADRVERFNLRPLSPVARANFVAAWQKIQSRFVDDPHGALTEADKLIQAIMTARGYPVSDFEQRAADISANHPLVVEHYRAGHDISLAHAKGRASTEDMRQAIVHYRTLFAELAQEPELNRTKTAKAGSA